MKKILLITILILATSGCGKKPNMVDPSATKQTHAYPAISSQDSSALTR